MFGEQKVFWCRVPRDWLLCERLVTSKPIISPVLARSRLDSSWAAKAPEPDMDHRSREIYSGIGAMRALSGVLGV